MTKVVIGSSESVRSN